MFTERDFCYWLQGFFEVGFPETLTHKQVNIIRQHLSLVFNKKTAEPEVGYDGYDPLYLRNMNPVKEKPVC